MRLWIAIVVTLVGLSGCVEDEEASEASVGFDSAGDGVHADSTPCTDGAALYGGGTIDTGTVQVTVTDGAGDQVFAGNYHDVLELEAENLEGADGEWRLQAERVAGFDGDYAFTLVCT